jgi:hypothetical protein
VRRQHLAAIALWIVLICVGTMFGASVYQRIALILNWPLVARRRWISRGAILFFLMLDEITRMARAWIFWDWFRIAGTLGSYLLFIKAASDPT